MPNIGPLEVAIVLIIALIVMGPKKLPDMGRSIGRGMREFKGAISGDHDDRRDDDAPALSKATAADDGDQAADDADANASERTAAAA